MFKEKEEQFYVGIDAHPWERKGQDIVKSIRDVVDLMRKYRLGNYFEYRGTEPGEQAGPSLQTLLLDPKSSAAQAAIYAAKHNIGTAYVYVDFSQEMVDYLKAECGELFLGPIISEADCLPTSDWNAPNPAVNDSNRHLNHNPEPFRAKNMLEAKNYYVQWYTDFVNKYHKQGVPKVISEHASFFHHYGLEAGGDIPSLELFPKRVQPMLSSLRGAARTYDKDLLSSCIAIGWFGGSNYDPLKPLRWKAGLFSCYLHGVRMMLQETGQFGITEFGDKNELGMAHPLSRKYRRIAADFYRFTKVHSRPKGFPAVDVAFLQGNLDGWGGDPNQEYVWGQTQMGDKWKAGAPERGWKLLDQAYPLFPARPESTDHFSGAPFGQVDVVPATAPAEKLSAYKCLAMTSWNTMTADIHDNLVKYVKQGGTLFLSLAHFNTSPERDGAVAHTLDRSNPKRKVRTPWKLFNNGDLRRLCGVKVLGPEEADDYPGTWHGSAAKATFNRSSICGIGKGRSYILHWPKMLAQLRLSGAKVVATSQEGKPLLVEYPNGKGRVLLLCLWEWPGTKGLEYFCGDIVAGLLKRYQRTTRLNGSQWVDWAEYEWSTTCSNIYLLNTNLHEAETGTLSAGRRMTIPFELAPGQISIVYRHGHVLLQPESHMLGVQPQPGRKGVATFTVDSSKLKKTGTTVHLYLPENKRPKKILLDQKSIRPRKHRANGCYVIDVEQQKQVRILEVRT